jgi:hypothetical protein
MPLILRELGGNGQFSDRIEHREHLRAKTLE